MDKLMEQKLNFDFKTNQQLLKKIAVIEGFRGFWMGLKKGSSRFLKQLKNIATVQSIGSSTRIEGSTLTDNEVQSLINHLKISKLKTRDQQEVAGYYETLEFILEEYKNIELTEVNIRQLHNMLMKFSTKDKHHKGGYKTQENKVVAFYPEGVQKIIFNTTPSHLTALQMHQLVEWTMKSLKEKELHPLMVISAFVYEFLSIHPFQDGNGRLSRLLTTLLLLQLDYDFVKYVSFEQQVEQNKKEYYKALMQSQKYRETKKEIISGWMLFFVSSLETMVKKLELIWQEVEQQKMYLNERQQKIFDFIQNKEMVKLGDVQKAFPKISVNTIKKDLQTLTMQKKIIRQGKLKSTVYSRT